MEIQISDIPEEGLHEEGELPQAIFGLAQEDSIRPVGHVHFSTDLYLTEDLVTFVGHLHGPFQIQCNTCLEYVDYYADFPHWQSDLDLDPGQRSFDLATIIRDDFLMALPSHPFCEELVPGRVCPKSDLLAEIQEAAEIAEDQPEERPDPWEALDQWKS